MTYARHVTDQPPDLPASPEPIQPYPQDEGDSASTAVRPPTEQPPSIRTAVMLMRAGALLSAIFFVATLAYIAMHRDEIRRDMQKSEKTYTPSQLDSAYTVSLISVVVLGVLFVSLWLWMASANGKGKPWARTMAVILGVFNILYSLVVLALGNSTALLTLYTLLNLGIAVGTLVFLYRADASRYYGVRARA